MRIIRTLFYLSVVGLFMPSPPPPVEPGLAAAPPETVLSTPQMFLAATSAVSDLREFCNRQPGFCDTAQYLAGKFEAKAKYSAKLIYEWANEASTPQGPGHVIEADALATASTQRVASADDEGLSQNTLRLEDLVPEWRPPQDTRKS